MALTISDHVRQRLRQRGVTEADLEWAMSHLTGNARLGEPGTKWVYGSTSSGRILKVCVKLDDPSYVITVAWPDQ
jgi:hypothetical protein